MIKVMNDRQGIAKNCAVLIFSTGYIHQCYSTGTKELHVNEDGTWYYKVCPRHLGQHERNKNPVRVIGALLRKRGPNVNAEQPEQLTIDNTIPASESIAEARQTINNIKANKEANMTTYDPTDLAVFQDKGWKQEKVITDFVIEEVITRRLGELEPFEDNRTNIGFSGTSKREAVRRGWVKPEAIEAGVKTIVENWGADNLRFVTGGADVVDRWVAVYAHRMGVPFTVVLPSAAYYPKYHGDEGWWLNLCSAAEQVLWLDGKEDNPNVLLPEAHKYLGERQMKYFEHGIGFHWLFNHWRNLAMILMSDRYAVVSDRSLTDLLKLQRGGTVNAVHYLHWYVTTGQMPKPMRINSQTGKVINLPDNNKEG